MKQEEGLDFEASLARAEEIVRLLEDGSVELDRAVALFEEGVALLHQLEEVVHLAEGRVEWLAAGEGDGERE
ncbi:MAG: exodeoxyribonuclease VII small subunit [Longimicrobiaceae bacterium]